jgi:uncharacterized protein
MLIFESTIRAGLMAVALVAALPAAALDVDESKTAPAMQDGAAGMVAPAPQAAEQGALSLPSQEKTRSLLPVPARSQFTSVKQALRQGVESIQSGDLAAAVDALKYASDQGNPSARFKLGQMYAGGEGVPQDDLEAFNFFRKITLENDEEAPDSPAAKTVARAFIAVGNYYRDGIPNSDIVPDMQEAYRNYHYAAAYFGDPDAQYNLARLYLDGALGEKDPTQAARWLKLAADKRHRYAQALLGHMLFYGSGIVRQPASGLAWLKLASDAASSDKDQWIRDSYRQADDASNDDIRKIAGKLIEQFVQR